MVVMLCQGVPLLPGSYLKVLKVAATNMFFISGSLFHDTFDDAEKLFAGKSTIIDVDCPSTTWPQAKSMCLPQTLI